MRVRLEIDCYRNATPGKGRSRLSCRLCSHECLHVKAQVLGGVGELRANRACATCQATLAGACRVRHLKMRHAGIELVGMIGESADRARRQTRLRRTAQTGRLGDQTDPTRLAWLVEYQRKPVRLPQPEAGVNQHSQRRHSSFTTSPGPGLKWPVWRPLERVYDASAKAGRDCATDPPAPTVQGVRASIAIFARGFKGRP